MAVASAKFEAGQVFLPQQAHWLPDLEAELFAFPAGKNDDQCDSISKALDDKNNRMLIITKETIAALRMRGPGRYRFRFD
jgi:phage terminase large subunit-like protein